jgi:hypothetical protein
MKVLAEAKGGVCLSENYANVKSRLRWRCAAGHEWETQASVIIGGHWCPKCEQFRLGRKYALSLEAVQKTAKERGGECLSDSYLNSSQKLTWRCSKGHMWQANSNSIRRGSWCPICARKRSSPLLNGTERIDAPPQINPFTMTAREPSRERQTEML